jgi:hypothetical protein
MSLRELARITGYGNNPARISELNNVKHHSETVGMLMDQLQDSAKRATRKDKLSGDPIWTRVWHEFTEVKKGQQFRSKMIKNGRVYDKESKRFVWKSEWKRHAKRFMVHRIAEMREMVIKWPPYLEWRARYLAKNPQVDQTWHVGEKRLYKEKCFCVDQQVCVT